MSDIASKVRVRRHPLKSTEQPWLVDCDYCNGGDWVARLWGTKVRGWAPTWRIAQDYAYRHAMTHEATRCPTCLHVPATETAEDRTSA